MSFFDKLSASVSELADKTAKTAGELKQKGEDLMEINKYKSQIDTLTRNLGKDIIAAKTAEKSDEEILALASTAYAQIVELNQKIKEVEEAAKANDMGEVAPVEPAVAVEPTTPVEATEAVESVTEEVAEVAQEVTGATQEVADVTEDALQDAQNTWTTPQQ